MKIKITVYILSLFLVGCADNEDVKSEDINSELNSTVSAYVTNAIDLFSEELEHEGGFFMWKNYRDYFGYGDVSFKNRINNTWQRSFDHKSLELYIKGDLAKNKKEMDFTLDKKVTDINSYSYVLVFPFLAFAIEEFISWLIILLLIEFIVIPYVARKITFKKNNTGRFLLDFTLDLFSGYVRESKINAEVAKIKRRINIVLFIFLSIFTIFFYDFNETLNNGLKQRMKENILNNITETLKTSN